MNPNTPKNGGVNAASRRYAEKLRDPRWQKKRLEVFERDGWACCECANAERNLQVHHLRYVWGRDPWEYDLLDLKTLCESCHQTATDHAREAKDLLNEILALAPNDAIQLIIGILKSEVGQYGLGFTESGDLFDSVISLKSLNELKGFAILQVPTFTGAPGFFTGLLTWSDLQMWPVTLPLRAWVSLLHQWAGVEMYRSAA